MRFFSLLSVVGHLFCVSAMAADTRGIQPPATCNLTPDDLMRVRASTDPNKSTFVEWQGQVLSYKPGEAPKVIFNVRGMNVARAVKLENGGYDLLARELQLYLDPKTNEILHTWHNPYSDKDVTVIHVANNPVYQSFPAGASYQARLLPGDSYSFPITIPLAYPNPLNPSGNTSSPLYPYQGPFQSIYSAIESFTFTFSATELRLPSIKSLETTHVYWTRNSPLLPWMATPSTNVSLLFTATGWKVKDGWQGLHPIVRDVIDKTVPAYKEAPTNRTSPGGGVSSWSYFARPEVLQGYLDGAVFPLPDPLVAQ